MALSSSTLRMSSACRVGGWGTHLHHPLSSSSTQAVQVGLPHPNLKRGAFALSHPHPVGPHGEALGDVGAPLHPAVQDDLHVGPDGRPDVGEDADGGRAGEGAGGQPPHLVSSCRPPWLLTQMVVKPASRALTASSGLGRVFMKLRSHLQMPLMAFGPSHWLHSHSASFQLKAG